MISCLDNGRTTSTAKLVLVLLATRQTRDDASRMLPSGLTNIKTDPQFGMKPNWQ
jgi:hypothetical protein